MTILPFPSFHDGRLTSIAVAEKTASLGLLRSDGVTFRMKLDGVEAFRADQFLEGNIILHIEVVRGGLGERTDVHERLATLFPAPHPSAADAYHDAYEQRLREMERRIMNGDAALVSLEPSYGCDLIAVCANVELNPTAKSVFEP